MVRVHFSRRQLCIPYGLFLALFVVIPMLLILFYAFTEEIDGVLTFTFSNFLNFFTSTAKLSTLLMSFTVAIISTTICLAIAYPVAYILARSKLRRRNVLLMLFILPMWINFLLRVLAMQMLLSNTGIINALLGFFGLPAQRIMYTKGAILIGMVYDYLPFMILPIYNVMSKIDKDVIEAAQDLGATVFVTFRKIIVPLSLPGVISGVTMVFIPSMSEFVVADILGGSKILLLGNVIEQEFNLSNNWNLGSGLSIVLMVFILISMAVMNRSKAEEGDTMLW